MVAALLLIAAIVVVGGALAFVLLGKQSTPGPGSNTLSAHIDPFTLQEPWRRYVQSAMQSRRRLDDVVNQRADGPMRDRLADTVRQVDDIVARIWEAAQEGHAISSASRLADLPSLERRISTTETQLADLPDERRGPLESSLGSLRSSVEVGRRLARDRDQASDRLRELNARLDELVIRGIEVSASNVNTTDADTLRAELDSLVVDVEGLRQGLAETKRVATA